ncbi:MAG: rhodanese-like domain-containing protein [Lachnospiraceae bacterium]|nr:rhodanese-like domain-containing protein [Lachnospiraceae bacterium]
MSVKKKIAGFLARLAGAGSRGAVDKIPPEEAKAIMDSGRDCIILDVREETEYREGHIAGALLIPVGQIEEKCRELLPDEEQLILVYCHSGVRSVIAAKKLAKLGYRQVKDFGGLMNWPYEL